MRISVGVPLRRSQTPGVDVTRNDTDLIELGCPPFGRTTPGVGSAAGSAGGSFISAVGTSELEICLDLEQNALVMAGRAVLLTRTQFAIVAYLIQHAGHWVSALELIEQVLCSHHQPDTSLIRVHVHGIRRRLGAESRQLQSDRRLALGYRWMPGASGTALSVRRLSALGVAEPLAHGSTPGRT